jgi:cytochrome c1
MADRVKYAMENEKKTSRPSTTLIVIILLAVVSTLVCFIKNKFKNSNTYSKK